MVGDYVWSKEYQYELVRKDQESDYRPEYFIQFKVSACEQGKGKENELGYQAESGQWALLVVGPFEAQHLAKMDTQPLAAVLRRAPRACLILWPAFICRMAWRPTATSRHALTSRGGARGRTLCSPRALPR